MKKVISILLMLAIIFAIGGCITDDKDDDKDKGDTGGTVTGSFWESDSLAVTYFPLTDGMKWTYLVGDNYGNGPIKSTDTRTINGTMDYENNTWAQMKDSSGSSTSYRIEDNNVYMIGNIFMTKPVLENVPAKTAYYYGFQSLMFDFNKSYGETWTVFTNFWDTDELQLTQIMTGEYIGTETVYVPAGQYLYCRKYLFDFEQVQNERQTGTEALVWLAPNVGIVKMTKVYSDSGYSFRTVTYDLTGFETGE